MPKIIWFLIHPENKNIPLDNIDVFNSWLNFISFSKIWYKIIFWWIWDLSNYKDLEKVNFRSDWNYSLDDRNIVIDFSWNEIIIENDWLWSIPIFYNKEERIISTLSLKTIWRQKNYDLNAISDYFKAWYCIFWNTILKEVKYLRFSSLITVSKNGLQIIEKQDDCLKILNKNKWKILPKNTLEKINIYINKITQNTKNIIIPTSWWFDSRLLNNMIKDKKKIKSFSYWISKDPYKSFETIYAKKLSEKLKTEFKVIELNEYYNEEYLKAFFNLFGISTHLHWMYHIELYKKIFNDIKKEDSVVLSGIVWDVWAWKVIIWNIKSENDIKKLYYSHWLCIEGNILSKNIEANKNSKKFYNKYSDQLITEEMRIIYLIRTKLILLSYLMIIPEYLWVTSETPFLNKEICLDILSLPNEERKWRNWQKEYFKSEWIYFEEMNIKTDISNSLDQITLSKHKGEMKLKNIPNFINEQYINNINRCLENRDIENIQFRIISSIFWEKLTTFLKFWLNKFFWIRWLFNKNLDALYHYLILKIFEYVEKRWK